MGQKINPNGFRVGIIKDWDSRWMVKKNQMADCIVEDHKIRTFLKEKLYACLLYTSNSGCIGRRWPDAADQRAHSAGSSGRS